MPSTNTIYVKLPNALSPYSAQLGYFGPLEGLGMVSPNFTIGFQIAPDGYLHMLATTMERLLHLGPTTDPVDRVQMDYLQSEVGWAERDAGNYHPRFYKGGFLPAWDKLLPLSEAETKAAMMAEEKVDILDGDLIEIARTVAPSPKTKDVFGAKISNVLTTACIEVEAQCKGILRANDYALPTRPNTADYVKLCAPMQLDQYSVRLQRYADYGEIRPFKGWIPKDPNIPGSGGTDSLPWYNAYNQVKHDQLQNFELGTLEHALSAVAAVHVLLFAQYGATFSRQLTRGSFFVLNTHPFWHHKDRTYAPLRGGSWTPAPYTF